MRRDHGAVGDGLVQNVLASLGHQVHITIKELIPILIAVMTWGKKWRSYTVVVFCDNEAVVTVLGSRCCKKPTLMHML